MEINNRIECYLSSFKVAENLYKKKVINKDELINIEVELAKKYELKENSIIRNNLLSSLYRENMVSGDNDGSQNP